MSMSSNSPLDRLWDEYAKAFKAFDDLTLARWMAQTLGQLQGRVWRFSHPLMATYRVAAMVGHERQIWRKRLVAMPSDYPEAVCCRAPLVPLLSRDVVDAGLICLHCNETAIAIEDTPVDLQPLLKKWAGEYSPVHAVAHWDESQQRKSGDYDAAYEQAARQAERLLAMAGRQIAPRLLEFYPTIAWEDQDECLEVRPEDILA